jgi:hypothetical protein
MTLSGSFHSVRPRVRLALALAVALSAAVFVLSPTSTSPAGASTCPPGWSSCTSWANAPNECCGGNFVWQTKIQVCTRWDHDVNAYPNCTYKVVEQWENRKCSWSYC